MSSKDIDKYELKETDIEKKNKAIIKALKVNGVDINIDSFDYKKISLSKLALEVCSSIDSENDNNQTVFENSQFLSTMDEWKGITVHKIDSEFKELQNHKLIRNGIITIGGYENSGKTTFATQIALSILRNNPNSVFMMYSLDDSKEFIEKKLLKQLLNYTDCKSNINDVDTLSNKILDYVKDLDTNITDRIRTFDNLDIFIDTSTSNIVNNIKSVKNAYTELDTENNKLELVLVIDYLQILEHTKNNNYEGLNQLLKELKNIQKVFSCTIILISQFSNEGKYSGSRQIRATSDVLLTICSGEIYKKDNPNDKAANNLGEIDKVLTVEKTKEGLKLYQFTASTTSNFCFNDFKSYKSHFVKPSKKQQSTNDFSKAGEVLE